MKRNRKYKTTTNDLASAGTVVDIEAKKNDDKWRKDSLDKMYLLDCLEHYTKFFEKAVYFY